MFQTIFQSNIQKFFIFLILTVAIFILESKVGLAISDNEIKNNLLKYKYKADFDHGSHSHHSSHNKQDSDFLKMLSHSQVKNKKNLYDEYMIYEFLAKKYPFLRNENIAKKIKKGSLYGDSKMTDAPSIQPNTLIERYKKNPSLLNQPYESPERANFRSQVKNLWHNKIFSSNHDEKKFLDTFSRILTKEDHEIRLEKLLWSGEGNRGKYLLTKVSPEVRAKSKLRLEIQASETVNELFKKFNNFDSSEKDRQILLFDAIQWCKKRKMEEEAIRLMEIVPLKGRIENKKWFDLIKPFLRSMLMTNDRKNYELAYKIAASHGFEKGKIDYVDMEFFSGFIAFEFLKKPDLAVTHFINSYNNAKQDFRKSRGAYWAGNCYAAMAGDSYSNSPSSSNSKSSKLSSKAGHKSTSTSTSASNVSASSLPNNLSSTLINTLNLKNKYFTLASNEFTTFYGQLALLELKNINIINKYLSKTSQADIDSVFKNPLFKYYYSSLMTKNSNLSRKIAKIITLSAKSKGEIALLAQIATYFHMPDISVYIGNFALYNMNYFVLEALYPIPNYKHLKFNPALNLAIIKRESNFSNDLVSNAGSRGNAHGLMQIIPGAGSDIAKQMGVSYDHSRLLNPQVNVQFGNHWLQYLSKKYDGSEILIAAAYNAGSGSVKKWVNILGDPRGKNVNTLDWIEQIPFWETRYYVQSVLSSMMIYRILMKNS